mmetsp:Transcript_22584/g.46026  ORF Transcript_22584/g.46026 Transcript_22584/m.46026 type:complete len:231 (-) Transcript_22584:185-877(-)
MDELGVAQLCSRGAPRLRGDELEEQQLLAALLLSARLAGAPPVEVPLTSEDGATDGTPTLTEMEEAAEVAAPPMPAAAAARGSAAHYGGNATGRTEAQHGPSELPPEPPAFVDDLVTDAYDRTFAPPPPQREPLAAPAAGAWWWPAALKATVVAGDAPAPTALAATTLAEYVEVRGEGDEGDAVSCASSEEYVGTSDATDEWEPLSSLSGGGGGASSDRASDRGGPDATL